jgi:hypothetical protein
LQAKVEILHSRVIISAISTFLWVSLAGARRWIKQPGFAIWRQGKQIGAMISDDPFLARQLQNLVIRIPSIIGEGL